MSLSQFDCTRCGACCFSSNPQYVAILPEDAGRIIPPTALAETGRHLLMTEGRCAQLCIGGGQATCAIYAVRPEACRAFRAGSFECQRNIDAKGALAEAARALPLAGTCVPFDLIAAVETGALAAEF